MGKTLEEGRLELQEELSTLIGHAYFQPPESFQLSYPCAVYELSTSHQRYANNGPYRRLPCYSVTVIDRNQELDWVEIMLDTFSHCAFERQFNSDNLAHYVFILYHL